MLWGPPQALVSSIAPDFRTILTHTVEKKNSKLGFGKRDEPTTTSVVECAVTSKPCVGQKQKLRASNTKMYWQVNGPPDLASPVKCQSNSSHSTPWRSASMSSFASRSEEHTSELQSLMRIS